MNVGFQPSLKEHPNQVILDYYARVTALHPPDTVCDDDDASSGNSGDEESGGDKKASKRGEGSTVALNNLSRNAQSCTSMESILFKQLQNLFLSPEEQHHIVSCKIDTGAPLSKRRTLL